MVTDTVWREIVPLAPELFRCDLCGEQATTIHLVPWVGIQCEQALFACERHDPGGYWFKLEDWLGDRREHWAQHLDQKVDHDRADADQPGGLALLYERESELVHPVVDAPARATADDVRRALNAVATAAQEAVLEYAHQFDRREDYEPLEDLAERVQRAVLEAGLEAGRSTT